MTSGELSPRVSRRALLGAAGAGVIGGAVVASVVVSANTDDDSVPAAADTYPFYGSHQAGITTPAQDRLHFAVFDVTSDDRDEVIDLLRRWTDAAAELAAGRPIGRFGAVAPPEDTGEALDLPASGLTLTFGFGLSFFETPDGEARFGLDDRAPKRLIKLPHFPGDALRPELSDGDICIQACSNDPQVAVHAIRNLARMAFGVASVRWSQLGFGRTSSTSAAQATPRNLFGFKDGTANIKSEDSEDLGSFVWVDGADGDSSMAGGTYLVARRISMHIETWDRTSLDEQEKLVGRQKSSGAPLSGGDEFTTVDLAITGREDKPLVPIDSHVRVAHPDSNNGVKMLRRGYNFTDGTDGLGRLDAGLFFLAFVRDPGVQYVPMQMKMAREDRMSVEYLQHRGSALFAIPPGTNESGYIGETFFA